ncbi:hypothetical protein J6590_058138 [Homalodisca vitripennis]|nr:hypothetical protein J6590_058138 [Homalodisca vitripennis]
MKIPLKCLIFLQISSNSPNVNCSPGLRQSGTAVRTVSGWGIRQANRWTVNCRTVRQFNDRTAGGTAIDSPSCEICACASSAAPCRPHASLSGERLVVAHCFVCDAAIMASWSKDNLLQFIEEFRKHECVWKVKSKDYHNREKKEAAHRSLLLVVKGFDSTATKSDVLKKINNIRSAFRKEQRKVTASQRSGSGTDDIYVPKLWYYRELLFLIDQEECLGGTSNLGEGRVSEDEVRELNY